jgi:unsaturated rhamnogalacturonyl hydrolase
MNQLAKPPAEHAARQEAQWLPLLRATAARTMRYDYTVWFWGDAIAFDGLMDAADVLGDPAPRDFCRRFVDRFAKRNLVFNDHLAPGGVIARLHRLTREQRYLDQAKKLADFLLHETPRGSDGAPLYKPELPMYRQTVYVDSIYHMPPFYALMGQMTGDTRFFDYAVTEWKTHVAVLSVPGKPFLCHAYDNGYLKTRGYGWGRGSGWALYGLVDTLELLPTTHPGYAETKAYTLRFAEAIRQVQDASGFWRTLLHDEEAYLESSTASFFGAAFEKGVRMGLWGSEFQKAADLAWHAMLSRLDAEGNFRGVSACTWAGTTTKFDDSDMYKTLPTEVNVWGQGSALRFLCERLISARSTTI